MRLPDTVQRILTDLLQPDDNLFKARLLLRMKAPLLRLTAGMGVLGMTPCAALWNVGLIISVLFRHVVKGARILSVAMRLCRVVMF